MKGAPKQSDAPMPRAIGKELTQEDYDFSNVPTKELESCLYYEYMRESEAIIREIKNLRLQLVRAAERRGGSVDFFPGLRISVKKITHHRGFNFETQMFFRLTSMGKFPDVPWQKLLDSDKSKVMDLAANARRYDRRQWLKAYPPLVVETLAKNPALGETTLNAWIAKQGAQYIEVSRPEAEKRMASAPEGLFLDGLSHKKNFASGVFRINLNYSQPDLRKAFDDWLKANHPQIKQERQKPGGRKSMHDQLNALGAMRLRYHCQTLRSAQAKLEPLRKKQRGMYYADRKAFNRACKAAVRNFHALLQLSEEILPIHFTTGWQK